MDNDYIFRVFLMPAAGIIWARYFCWPILSAALILLIKNKYRPTAKLQNYLNIIWWVTIVIGVTLLTSLTLALFTMPEHDLQIRGNMYFMIILSLPALIPCFIALFFKPPH